MPIDPQWIMALSASGAGAVMEALLADALGRTRALERVGNVVARLFGRGDPEATARVAAELDAQAARLRAAAPEERAAIEGELAAGWRARFARLLEERPEAAAELQGLAGYVQHNTARDGGTVYAVQGGDQIIHPPGGTR